jgi:hypothetical protein
MPSRSGNRYVPSMYRNQYPVSIKANGSDYGSSYGTRDPYGSGSPSQSRGYIEFSGYGGHTESSGYGGYTEFSRPPEHTESSWPLEYTESSQLPARSETSQLPEYIESSQPPEYTQSSWPCGCPGPREHHSRYPHGGHAHPGGLQDSTYAGVYGERSSRCRKEGSSRSKSGCIVM